MQSLSLGDDHMNSQFRVTLLAAAISVCGGSFTTVSAADITALATTRTSYIIDFEEAGALDYQGGEGILKATAPAERGGHPFDVKSAEVVAYRAYLAERQAEHLGNIESALGRQPLVTHRYELTQSGIAAQLTADEAAKIARLPGVKSVSPDTVFPLDTYRGPTFIGADTIWNGSAVPGNSTSRGEGAVIGIIDSGIYAAHPSFADDASCGFGPTNHKLRSTQDCSTSTATSCTGPNPEADASSGGHGVHTASTAGGNVVTNSATPSPNLPSPYTQISGVAPCAALRTYKVCTSPTSCVTSYAIAAVNSAIASGDVKAINFSIGGGTSPWSTSDVDRAFLNAVNAGIFVAASAGNTTATITSPIGQVNHRGPWVTTVAASTQDKSYGAGLSATGPGTPPAATQNIIGVNGSITPAAIPFTNLPIKLPDPVSPLGCDTEPAYPANYFAGSVALIPRGTCSFYLKIDKAAAAGAQAVFIYNNTYGSINMDTSAQTSTIPAYSITQVTGQALAAFITANGATTTTASLVTPSIGTVQGDVLADFSFRGPTPGTAGGLTDTTKPDITAPGVNIWAAWAPIDGGVSYQIESGTSMSGPHTAGAGALLRMAQPSWTPVEVKSALMLTAFNAGTKEDLTTPWQVDDVGSGRVDLTKAARAGFVMNETYANFLAANPTGGSINLKTLNLPAVRNVALSAATPSYTWTRVLRNSSQSPTTWNVSVVQPAGVTVTVSPSTFSFTGVGVNAPDAIFVGTFDTPVVPETQTLTITATTTAATASYVFGQINFTEAGNLAPPAHISVAVRRQ
jgi:subtilisin family serine protease